jgi:GT2 family glycosyltransferase
MKPAFSVVIPNWNGLAHLGACLSALRAQTCRDFETVLVDNGSRDESVAFVRENFPEVRVVALDENRGFAGGVNAGIEAARGEFIALLNNDTEADPGWLAALRRATREGAGYGMWASRVVLSDRPEIFDSAGDGLTLSGAPFKRRHLEAVGAFERGQEVFGPSGAAALYRRDVIEDAGGLDEDFFLVHEDVDLALRARLRGHRCWYVADAVVRHKVNSSIGYMSWKYVFYGQRNLEYLFWKDMPLPLLLRCLPAHCLFDLLALGHFAARGRGLAFLGAKGAALLKLPAVWRKRRAAQARRLVSAASLLRQLERRWLGTKLRSARALWRLERRPARID